MPWYFDPQSGGVKIPPRVQESTRKRILDYADKRYRGKYTRLDVRFKGVFCYVDAYKEPHVPANWPPKDSGMTREEFIERQRKFPHHLVRMRHFAEDRWSVAFYTYSNEKYEPCIFPNGTWFGTPEEAFEIGAVYLQD